MLIMKKNDFRQIHPNPPLSKGGIKKNAPHFQKEEHREIPPFQKEEVGTRQIVPPFDKVGLGGIFVPSPLAGEG